LHFFLRYYGLKPLLDEANIRIKELERENDFLKWSKTVQDNTIHTKKNFCDVLTQTQSILQLDKVYLEKKNNCLLIFIYVFVGFRRLKLIKRIIISMMLLQ
jgi:hypothetical protein